MADMHYASVSLLLHCDGANAGTSFTDSSSTPLTVTTYGNAQTSTTVGHSGFGTAVAKFDGSGDYLSTPSTAALSLQTVFTIDAWVYLTSNITNYASIICRDSGSNSASQWNLLFLASNAVGLATYDGTNQRVYAIASAGEMTLDTWHFISVSVDSTAGYVWTSIDGVVTQNVFLGGAINSTTLPCEIGRYTSGHYFTGYLDEIRVTKGVARNTSNFSVPTEPFSTRIDESATMYLQTPSPSVGMYGGSTLALTCPSPLFYAGVVGYASLDLSPPAPTLSYCTGAYTSLTAPSPKLSFLTHDSTGEQAAYLTAPSPTLVCRAGANAYLTAPSPTLASGMTITNFARVDATAPSPTLSSSGTVSDTASFNLTAPSPNLIGYGGAVCSVQITGRPQLVASATVGSVASFAVTCPLFELTASASADNIASFDLIAPSPEPGRVAQAWLVAPMAQLTAIGTATITATYEAYAVNLKHSDPDAIDETTRYTNFPFTHVVRYKNSYYGANSTGLYLLEGTTDDGAAIPFDVKTAMTDFKSSMKKTLASAYFSGRFGPASTITLTAGEGTPVAYSFSTPRDQAAQNHRQVFGKGVKERYYALEVAGTGTLELDGIEMDVAKLSRRI